MKIKVDVKKVDISKGTVESSSSCPVARAVRRLLKSGFEASVNQTYIRIARPSDIDCTHFEVPTKVATFIKRFDAGASKLKPFSFTITVPADKAKELFKPSALTVKSKKKG